MPGAAGRVPAGMIHGRFQPFHNGHLEYAQLAAERCDALFVGITNPEPSMTAEEAASQHRHLPEANPFTFIERLLMIREALTEAGLGPDRVIIVPFPVNQPQSWVHYIPGHVVHFLRVFSEWEQTKVDRLREHRYTVEVLQPGHTKEIEATEVRRRLDAGDDWEPLVPPAVARHLRRRLEATAQV